MRPLAGCPTSPWGWEKWEKNRTSLTAASDRIVEKNVAGTITEIEYSPIGKVAVMSGTTQKQAYVPLPGGEMLSPGPDTYWHADWLGTVY